MNEMRFDVFLDTGVCVRVPAGTDPDTAEGYEIVKRSARDALLELLNGGGFDIQCDEYRSETIAEPP